MKPSSTLLAVAIAAAVAACGQDDSPVRTSSPVVGDANPAHVQASAPAAQPDRDTPPAETPATHAGAPEPAASVGAAPAAGTARDTPAQRPMGELTPTEEAKSMPKPGQTDNHSTPSIQGDLKGSQQSPGSPTTSTAAQPAPSTATDATGSPSASSSATPATPSASTGSTINPPATKN